MTTTEPIDLYGITDSQVWAQAFMDTFGRSRYDIDLAKMVAWFSLAIEND